MSRPSSRLSSLLTWKSSQPRQRFRRAIVALVAALAFLSAGPGGAARAQGAAAGSTEEKFQDLFVTAGYCAAFGAAVGTAMLAFVENPTENLKYVAVGASVGFLGGSVLGSYIIFSPAFAQDGGPSGASLASAPGALPDHGLVVRPTFDTKHGTVKSFEGGLTLARF